MQLGSSFVWFTHKMLYIQYIISLHISLPQITLVLDRSQPHKNMHPFFPLALYFWKGLVKQLQKRVLSHFRLLLYFDIWAESWCTCILICLYVLSFPYYPHRYLTLKLNIRMWQTQASVSNCSICFKILKGVMHKSQDK